MADILHRVEINASPARVFEAIARQEGLSAWWTTWTKAEPVVGSVAEFGFDDATTKMRIEELVPERRVAWWCVGGPEEWIGTRVSFELEPGGQGTIVRFGQHGWKAASDFYMHCNAKWSYFLHSLKAFVETGKGSPYPRDVKI